MPEDIMSQLNTGSALPKALSGQTTTGKDL